MKDIKNIIQEYTSLIKPETRYASFDYCYNYFKTTKDLTKDMEKSCLSLGFYLASWGMYRGSSYLLQKSVKHFEPVINYISTLDPKIWEIDVDKYNKQNIQTILEVSEEIKSHLQLKEHASLTLVTKILLGVFGFTPAFDTYFTNTFRKLYKGKCGFSVLNENALKRVKNFYVDNQSVIDNISNDIYTIDFISGKKTKINYPKAKIIDMFGFTLEYNKSKHKKNKKQTQ